MLVGEEEVGFEIFYEETDEVIDGDEDLEEIAAGRDCCISLVWRGSMKDLACVMIVSCALAKDFGAVISFEGDLAERLDAMLDSTRKIVADAIAGKA